MLILRYSPRTNVLQVYIFKYFNFTKELGFCKLLFLERSSEKKSQSPSQKAPTVIFAVRRHASEQWRSDFQGRSDITRLCVASGLFFPGNSFSLFQEFGRCAMLIKRTNDKHGEIFLSSSRDDTFSHVHTHKPAATASFLFGCAPFYSHSHHFAHFLSLGHL